MADDLGARGGQQHEGGAGARRGGGLGAVVIERPDIAAELFVTVLLPEIAHAMVDDFVRAGPAKQGAYGEAMLHAGGGVDRPDGIFGINGLAMRGEVDEPALGVD